LIHFIKVYIIITTIITIINILLLLIILLLYLVQPHNQMIHAVEPVEGQLHVETRANYGSFHEFSRMLTQKSDMLPESIQLDDSCRKMLGKILIPFRLSLASECRFPYDGANSVLKALIGSGLAGGPVGGWGIKSLRVAFSSLDVDMLTSYARGSNQSYFDLLQSIESDGALPIPFVLRAAARVSKHPVFSITLQGQTRFTAEEGGVRISEREIDVQVGCVVVTDNMYNYSTFPQGVDPVSFVRVCCPSSISLVPMLDFSKILDPDQSCRDFIHEHGVSLGLLNAHSMIEEVVKICSLDHPESVIRFPLELLSYYSLALGEPDAHLSSLLNVSLKKRSDSSWFPFLFHINRAISAVPSLATPISIFVLISRLDDKPLKIGTPFYFSGFVFATQNQEIILQRAAQLMKCGQNVLALRINQFTRVLQLRGAGCEVDCSFAKSHFHQ
jgi:hypothetical protein